MHVIDLTKPIYDHMPVFSGDPDLLISQVYTLEKDGWNMKRVAMNLHDGTHVNVPIHADAHGKTLDDMAVERFYGQCVLFQNGMRFDAQTGVLFRDVTIDMTIAQQMAASPPKFIALSETFEMDLEVEKFTLAHGIISFENLTNTDALPQSFMFYGFPLKIKEGDGSPVRAVAMFG